MTRHQLFALTAAVALNIGVLLFAGDVSEQQRMATAALAQGWVAVFFILAAIERLPKGDK